MTHTVQTMARAAFTSRFAAILSSRSREDAGVLEAAIGRVMADSARCTRRETAEPAKPSQVVEDEHTSRQIREAVAAIMADGKPRTLADVMVRLGQKDVQATERQALDTLRAMEADGLRHERVSSFASRVSIWSMRAAKRHDVHAAAKERRIAMIRAIVDVPGSNSVKLAARIGSHGKGLIADLGDFQKLGIVERRGHGPTSGWFLLVPERDAIAAVEAMHAAARSRRP